MQIRNLPLRGIAVFEAASRLGSFHAAAEELSLTASAVSHQIRLLEELLGVELFERIGRGVRITSAGAEYARWVQHSVRRLRMATEELVQRTTRAGVMDVVTMRSTPSLAGSWLLPRLSEFLDANQNVDIRVNAEGGEAVGAAYDLIIVHGEPERWEGKASRFLEERIQPLVAPAVLARLGIKTPEDLLDVPLIRTGRNPFLWEDWFQRQGIDLSKKHRSKSIQLDPSHLAILAAVQGMGMVLESDVLTESEVASGALVAPFPDLAFEGQPHWILSPQPESMRRATSAVCRWLLSKGSAPCQ